MPLPWRSHKAVSDTAGAANGSIIIRAEGVNKDFGGVLVLKDIRLDVRR
jgi:hypothetical protein